MKHINYLTFKSSFEDTTKFGKSGEILIPGGLKELSEIVNEMNELGIVTSEPAQYEYYGWQATSTYKNYNIWMLLQEPEDWLLSVNMKSGIFNFNKKPHVIFSDFMTLINDKINSNSSFKNLKSYTRKDYEN